MKAIVLLREKQAGMGQTGCTGQLPGVIPQGDLSAKIPGVNKGFKKEIASRVL